MFRKRINIMKFMKCKHASKRKQTLNPQNTVNCQNKKIFSYCKITFKGTVVNIILIFLNFLLLFKSTLTKFRQIFLKLKEKFSRMETLLFSLKNVQILILISLLNYVGSL